MIMDVTDKIFVAGHRGLVGSALVRALHSGGYRHLVLAERSVLDLTKQEQVEEFFAANRPAYVLLAAARVGGILANDSYPADFIRNNLQIQTNVIDCSYRYGVRKLLFLGSSCIYPKHAPQPMSEDCLLTGPLEPTNQWYATAKIAGLKMCQAYRRQYGFNAICAMPTNLFGPGDNFDLHTSHVLPALLRKFHVAKLHRHPEVVIWGTGSPRREFLYVGDLADACLFLLRHYDAEAPINVGCGQDVTIMELARTIAAVVGFEGELRFDVNKPDGTPRKLLDVSRLTSLGWTAQTSLRDGIEMVYRWYLANQEDGSARHGGDALSNG
jgi:GDP-L-fucose synthase